MMISQLVKKVWSLFLTEGSSFYQSSLVDIVGKASQESTPEAGVKVTRKRGVPRGKGAPKKKSRRQELLEQLRKEEGAEDDGDGQGDEESADSGAGDNK